MKNRKFQTILAAILAGSMLMLSACGANGDGKAATGESAQDKYKMKIGTATTNEVQTHIMDVFKAKVEERTSGKIEVELYPSGQLGSNDQMGQQVATGAIEGVVTASSFGFDELLTALDLPYVWPDIDTTVEYLNSGGGKVFQESMEKNKGVTIARFYPYGPRTILSKKKIETIEDFKGQKIRVQSAKVLIDKINAWGGTGIAMGVPEMYTALQQGTIDGIDNVAGVHYSGKYHDNAKYLLTESSSPLIIIFLINTKWLNGLPEELKTAVLELAAEIDGDIQQYAKDFHESALEGMKAEGVEIIEPSEELHQALVDASKNIVPDFVNRLPEAKPIVDEITSKLNP